jgi:hypothetical protein
MAHPADETLQRFARVQATRRENREVVAHLLKGCSFCSGRLAAHVEAERAVRERPAGGDGPGRTSQWPRPYGFSLR